MAEPRGAVWLSWDLVFKLATLLILIFSGISVEHVSRGVQEVETVTRQNREALKSTKKDISTTTSQIEAHTTAMDGTLQLLEELTPLFQDIVQRQRNILQDLQRTQATLDARTALFGAVQEELHRLTVLHTMLLEQCPALVPASPPTK